MSTDVIKSQISALIGVLESERENRTKPIDDAISALHAVARSLSSEMPALEIKSRSESSAAHTRTVILTILKFGGGRAVTVSDIARVAFDQHLLESKRGYKGVYADIAKALTRNKHLFVSTGERGFWKLKESAAPQLVRRVVKVGEVRGLDRLVPGSLTNGPPIPAELDLANPFARKKG